MLSVILSFNLVLSLFLFQLLLTQRIKGKEICCEVTGCFDDQPPFDQMNLPMCTDSPDTAPSFNLYTRHNPQTPYQIDQNHLPSNFSTSKPSYFISHGWNSNGQGGWVIEMKDEILNRDDVNVVVVDWTPLSNLANYAKVVPNVRTVGAHTGLVMMNMRKKSKKMYLYCIGHSLGSHVCAHAGLKLKIDRISGLDPAGPGFEKNENLEIGLNPKSASFVDVMHTDKQAGTTRSLGHLDFYPNGGKKQPGCVTNACSHSLAHSFFIESVKQDCFVATKKCSNYTDIPKSCVECKGCALMGYGASSSSRGIMYLETSKKAPYCLPVWFSLL